MWKKCHLDLYIHSFLIFIFINHQPLHWNLRRVYVTSREINFIAITPKQQGCLDNSQRTVRGNLTYFFICFNHLPIIYYITQIFPHNHRILAKYKYRVLKALHSRSTNASITNLIFCWLKFLTDLCPIGGWNAVRRSKYALILYQNENTRCTVYFHLAGFQDNSNIHYY